MLIVAYNNRSDLRHCIASLLQSETTGLELRVLVIDNASTDGCCDELRDSFREVTWHRSDRNTGFAGGNNAGWRLVQQLFPDLRYLVLLNPDTLVSTRWLVELVDLMQRRPRVAAAQPKIMLHPQTDRINTVGNRSHFLGFGFMVGYDEIDHGQYDDEALLDFASGAAMILRADLLRRQDLFDDAFFMYLEDADLCWRLRLAGHEVRRAPRAVVYHQYTPKAPYTAYEHLERNRWVLLLTYYRKRTLLLLLPAILFMELGQFFFALGIGKLAAKWRSMTRLLTAEMRRRLHARREQLRSLRTLSDRQFLGGHAGRIDTRVISHPLLRYLANPLLAAYWAVARRLLP